MKFKIPVKLLVVLCLVVVVAGFVEGYNLQVEGLPEAYSIQYIRGEHSITESGDLDSRIAMRFVLDHNYSSNLSEITIRFDTIESSGYVLKTDPDPQIVIGGLSKGERKKYKLKIHKFAIHTQFYYPFSLDYYTESPINLGDSRKRKNPGKIFTITFTPEETEWPEMIDFEIKYQVSNFILKQGDYYVAFLNLPYEKNNESTLRLGGHIIQKNAVNHIVALPSGDCTPLFIPSGGNTESLYYGEDKKGNAIYRLSFNFVGGEDILIWYLNGKELEEKEEKLQDKYIWKGFYLGLFGAIIILFLERFLFDWFPYKNRMRIWVMKKFRHTPVIGNTNNKKYHKTDCVFVDNIVERNKKIFKDKDSAEKEGYKPCEICNSEN